jgi:copper homeostasis protein CutC
MAGGGVTLRTVRQVLVSTGIREYHASLRKAEPSPADFHKQGVAMGERRDQEYLRYTTHEEDVRAMAKLLESITDEQPALNAYSA